MMEISEKKEKAFEYNKQANDGTFVCINCNETRCICCTSQINFGCGDCKLFICEDCMKEDPEKYYKYKKCPNCESINLLVMPETLEEYQKIVGK